MPAAFRKRRPHPGPGGGGGHPRRRAGNEGISSDPCGADPLLYERGYEPGAQYADCGDGEKKNTWAAWSAPWISPGLRACSPTEMFAPVFAKVREYGLPMTIHAGEAAGPDSMRTALSYGTKRIGHGVAAIEDPELVKCLVEEGITLEGQRYQQLPYKGGGPSGGPPHPPSF